MRGLWRGLLFRNNCIHGRARLLRVCFKVALRVLFLNCKIKTMKKNLFTILLLWALTIPLSAQRDTLTVGFFNIPAVTGNTYAFFQTISTLPTWNRTVSMYPRETLKRMPKDSFITAFQLFRQDSTLVTPYNPGFLRGSCKAKVWFGYTALQNLKGIDFWSDARNAIKPVLVIDKDIKTEIGSTSGWKTFELQTPFKVDTGKNIAIFVEYIQDSGSINNIIWTYDTTTVRPGSGFTVNHYDSLQFKFCHKPFSQTADPVDLFNFASGNKRRSNIRFIVKAQLTNTAELFSDVKDLKVYPNPIAQNELNYAFSAVQDLTLKVTILDITGRVHHQKKVEILRGYHSQSLDVQELKSGYYLLSIDDGKRPITKSFVKLPH